MDDSLLIPGILLVCLFAGLWGIGTLIRRRTGQRITGPIGMVAVVVISLALMWLLRQFVSPDSIYWWHSIAASTGIAALVSTVLFGKQAG